MATKQPYSPDIVDRLDRLEVMVYRIDRNLKRMNKVEKVEGFEEKQERVIFDGVKTMSQKEAETIPGHWEVRGREWVRIAD